MLLILFEEEVKSIDLAIKKTCKGINLTEYNVLLPITGIDPVFVSGILSEIVTVSNFDSNNKLAKYAGVNWRKSQSISFSSDNTRMPKTGNKYLRYYHFEATNSVIRLLVLIRKKAPRFSRCFIN